MKGDAMQPQPTLSSAPSLAECRTFVRRLTRWVGPGFHPDTPFREYALPDGARGFDRKTCQLLENSLSRATKVLDYAGVDVCAVAIPIQRRLLRQS